MSRLGVDLHWYHSNLVSAQRYSKTGILRVSMLVGQEQQSNERLKTASRETAPVYSGYVGYICRSNERQEAKVPDQAKSKAEFLSCIGHGRQR